MASDLEKAFDELTGKQPDYTRFIDYYAGDQPLRYTAARLAQIFPGIDSSFTQNWCAVVVDAVGDRISLTSLTAQDESLNAVLARIIRRNRIMLTSLEVHNSVLVCTEAFVVAWPDTLTNEPRAFYNDPRLLHVEYDPEDPLRELWAAKWWIDTDGYRRITLYYPDHLEYFISTKKADEVRSFKAFVPGPDMANAPNPYGRVPVFHFKGMLDKGELKDAIPIQDSINKLVADMMVGGEFQAIPQRYVISNMDTAGQLKNAPNEIWQLPAGDGIGPGTTVGSFPAADLGNYISAKDSLVGDLAAITRTPKHFFIKGGGDPSGEALVVMEAPVNKKATRYIDRFTETWRELCAFLLNLAGNESVDAEQIDVQFDSPQTVQPLTQASVRQTTVAAGVPLTTALRWEGKSQSEIDQMEQDRAAEAAQAKATLAAAMLQAQREFDQGQNTPTGGGDTSGMMQGPR